MLRFILKLLKTLLYLAVAGGLVLFAVMNRAPMTISLSPFPFEMTLPASFFALGVFILGLLMGYGLALSGTYKTYRHMKREQRKADALRHEVESLRLEKTIPPVTPLPARVTNV